MVTDRGYKYILLNRKKHTAETPMSDVAFFVCSIDFWHDPWIVVFRDLVKQGDLNTTTWCSDWCSQLNDVAVQKVEFELEYCFYFHAVWIDRFQTVCLGFYIISTLYSWLPRSEKHTVDTPKNIHSGDSVALSGATRYRWWHAAPNLQWAAGKNSTYFEGS